MLFNSISFLIFFPVTTAIFYALPYRARWLFLLAASCLFYMAFVPAYILILLFTILVDYIAGLLIEKSAGKVRKIWLAASIVANVGVLAAFKYFDFANANVETLSHLFHWNYPAEAVSSAFNGPLRALAGWHRWSQSAPLVGVLLPVGLSFHTFQAMSYTIEVYYGRQRAERHPGIYALYVLFYPQLVAGPIERPQHMLHQFRRPHRFSADRAGDGLRRMLWGFFKKLVIADRIAPIVDAVYNQPSRYGWGYLLVATYLFAFQIYCDFSGYTDIALGAARVLGFRLMENFDRPYASRSVGEFWHRWHISLSSWFRDYLYIPLGGSRVGISRWVLNVLIVFLASGLWHGASWTFALWGLLHGFYLVMSRLTIDLRKRLAGRLGIDRATTKWRACQMLITFHLVAFGWIFFRANSVSDAFQIVGRLARGPLVRGPEHALWLPFTRSDIAVAILLILVLECVQLAQKMPRVPEWFAARPAWQRWPAYYGLVLLIVCIGELGARSFIYFQF